MIVFGEKYFIGRIKVREKKVVEPVIVHYIRKNEERTLCGETKKGDKTGPWWIETTNYRLKNNVNCQICVKKAVV